MNTVGDDRVHVDGIERGLDALSLNGAYVVAACAAARRPE